MPYFALAWMLKSAWT